MTLRDLRTKEPVTLPCERVRRYDNLTYTVVSYDPEEGGRVTAQRLGPRGGVLEEIDLRLQAFGLEVA